MLNFLRLMAIVMALALAACTWQETRSETTTTRAPADPATSATGSTSTTTTTSTTTERTKSIPPKQ